MSTYIVASLPLPLYCGILLLAKQHETIQGLTCGITAGFDCGIMPALLRLDCRLDSSSHRTTCGITADLSDLSLLIDEQLRLPCRLISLYWHRCHFHTPVGLCCYESSMGPYKVFLEASLPTFICAHRRLRHHCCLTTSLSFIAALMPTCG
jgi:hypothetical protein